MDGAEIGRNYEALRLAGDAKATLSALLTELEQVDFSGRSSERKRVAVAVAEARAATDRHLTEIGTGEPGALRPEYMLRVLDAMLGPEDIVVTDASFATNWVSAYITARADGARILEPRGLAGLGWGFPMAIGAKLARPSAKVVAIVGDGGFGHCWSELEAARRLGIDVIVIVLNNGILGYQVIGEKMSFGLHTDAAVFFPVDHAAIARACDCFGEQVAVAADLKPALERALAAGRPALIDLMTDPAAYPPVTLFDRIAEPQAVPA